MNIIVRTAGGRVIARPDTTWVRKNEDFFPPDFVSALSFTPVLYARISKAGRCIGADFARRHFGETGFGLLLYPADLLKVGDSYSANGSDVRNSGNGPDAGNSGGFGDAWSVAAASCMDRTSYLPDLRKSGSESLSPTASAVRREGVRIGGAASGDINAYGEISAGGLNVYDKNAFCLNKNGTEFFRSEGIEAEALMAEAVVESSRIMYLRRDDLLAVELAAPAPFWSRAEGNAEIRALAGDQPLLDFNITVE